MRSSRALIGGFFVLVLLAFSGPSSARAQTFTGSLTSGSSWYRPDGSCVPEASPRLYQSIALFANQTGTYTFTATRVSGTGIAIDAYRTFPSSSCQADRYAAGSSGTTTGSVTVVVSNLDYPIVLVVSSGTSLATGSYTVTVSGPAPVSGDCSGTGTLTPSSQSAPIGGGSYSTTYTPPSGVECSGFAVLNKPAWITGMPTSGGGQTTINYTVAANPGGPRTANVSIGERTLTVTQAGTCSFALTPSSVTVSGAGGSAQTSVGVNSGCPWSASTATPWITIASPDATGPGTLAFTVDENTGAARSGTIDVEGATLTVEQNAACTYTLADTVLDLSASASAPTVSVTTQVGCPITGVSDVAWITPQASGVGSGTTKLSVAANTGAARSGSVTIGGESITVNQASGCAIGLPVSATTVPAAGTTSSFVVSTGAGCAYTVDSDAAWLSAAAGTGGVDFTAGPSVVATRVGTITVTSTSTASSAEYVVTQSSGCVPELASPGETRDAGAGIGGFSVAIDGTCSRTATSDVAWIHSVAVTASGVEFAVDANTGVERVGTIEVASSGGAVSYSVTQASGCAVTVSDAPLVLSPVGGLHYLTVASGEGCTFTATASVDWIELGAPEPSGIGITAWPNDAAARTTTVTITSVESGASDTAQLEQASLVAPPTILDQPDPQRVFVGDEVFLSVGVDSNDVEYQWRKDGVPIPENGPSLHLADVTLEDAGDYDVVVSNLGGSTMSQVATLEVSPRTGGCAAAARGGRAEGGWLFVVVAAIGLAARRRRRSRR